MVDCLENEVSLPHIIESISRKYKLFSMMKYVVHCALDQLTNLIYCGDCAQCRQKGFCPKFAGLSDLAHTHVKNEEE